MTKVVGVRFRRAGKIYYFDPGKAKMAAGSHVIVETARGIEYGTVLIAPKEVDDKAVVQPLKPVIRVATPEDDKTEQRNKEKEKEAYKICLEKIAKHKLEMKLVEAEYTFDNNKLLFYFTADGRIDFRDLVMDLAAVFRTRIELRQIGVRDETKILGGIGICGRELCCKSYLADFAPVSIKMAKEQNLSLNPTKISGVCGRLMCCLTNEDETFEELIRLLCKKDVSAIDSWFQDFSRWLTENFRTKSFAFIQIYSLLGRILKFFYELNLDTHDLEAKILYLYNHLEEFHTTEELCHWLNDLCHLLCNKLDSS